MTVAMPYRSYNNFQMRQLRGQDSNNDYLTIDDWTNDHLEGGEIGIIKNYSLGNNVWNQWRMIFKPVNAPDFQSFPGLDQISSVKIGISVTPPFYNSKPLTEISLNNGILRSPASPLLWEISSVTGKYYDGANAWDMYPVDVAYCLVWSTINYVITDLPKNQYIYEGAWNFGIGVHANTHQAHFWRSGICVYFADSVPNEVTWAADNGFRMNIIPNNMMVKYFNAVCNSLNRYSMPTAGGVSVVLNGLGFNNDNAEIDEGGAGKVGGWGDYVGVIYFEGLQGQGTYNIYLNPYIPPGFDIDSNSQITIATMPAMLAGTYQIKLRKLDTWHGTGKNIDSYAGDWRCDTDGRVYAGNRIIFTVGDTEDDNEDDIVIYTEWEWKNRTGSIFKYWAPIDTRTPLIFFDGRILDIGSFERSPSDISGLAQVSGLTVEIANHDQEISKLLAEYECLNCTVGFWWGFRNFPYATKSYLFSMVVAEYEKPHETWKVTLRDINARYF